WWTCRLRSGILGHPERHDRDRQVPYGLAPPRIRRGHRRVLPERPAHAASEFRRPHYQTRRYDRRPDLSAEPWLHGHEEPAAAKEGRVGQHRFLRKRPCLVDAGILSSWWHPLGSVLGEIRDNRY